MAISTMCMVKGLGVNGVSILYLKLNVSKLTLSQLVCIYRYI